MDIQHGLARLADGRALRGRRRAPRPVRGGLGEEGRAPRLSARVLLVAAVALASAAVAWSAGPKPDPARAKDGTDLAARLADAPIVILARCVDLDGKAHLAVESVFRGRNIPARLTLAFHALNMGRNTGTAPFKVELGERALFALSPRTDEHDDTVDEKKLQPVGGFKGRIPIPAEGGTALVDAVRSIVSYQDANDSTAGVAELSAWLAGSNPWLIELALSEAARLGVADQTMAPALLARAQDVSPARRRNVVEALGTALSRGRLTSRRATTYDASDDLDLARAATETIIRLARTDPDAVVRRAAVHELGRGSVADAGTILQVIAKDDPSQDVRYEAAASIADLARLGRRGS